MSDYGAAVKALPDSVKTYVLGKAEICKPDKIHVCDGSEKENTQIIKTLQDAGMIKQLTKYKNCWLTLTDPADVARVESKTVLCTKEKKESIPTPKPGITGTLGNWIDPETLKKTLDGLFPGCMKGRTMYVIPFSMGPVGGPISKCGVEITDSAYVVASMRIMTRMGAPVLKLLASGTPFVKALHSIGCPLPTQRILINNWPCNPEKLIISHIPDDNEIISFGSGYGGNSLLGKKCFALRIGSRLGYKEGWLAEHMLILGITTPKGKKRYLTAAFPSACGKTNLAMLQPSLPNYKVECVGDDIAWMKFNDKGELRAINPENGFFGVATGTSLTTNPNAMKTITSNTIFTNVASTSDGGFFWEGLEKEVDLSKVTVTDWLGKPWTKESGTPSAHPNSRFAAPARQCPMIDPKWEAAEGVHVEAIIFGGRRPEGIPLIYESFSWNHGVFIGGSIRSEATAAAEFKGKVIMHDPFGMRPFFGYNFGNYMKHWISLGKKYPKVPKIFHVNWFRKSSKGEFLWPGFGENCRILDWIVRRVGNEVEGVKTAIGIIPKVDDINISGLKMTKADVEEVLSLDKVFWQKEVKEIRTYFEEQLPDDLPAEIQEELKQLEKRIEEMK